MKTLTKKSNPIAKKAPDIHFNKTNISLKKKFVDTIPGKNSFFESSSRFYFQKADIVENKRWAQDWIEQMQYLKGHSGIMFSADRDMNEFCFYTDIQSAS